MPEMEATLIVREHFTGRGFACFDPWRLSGPVMHQLLNKNSGEVRSGNCGIVETTRL
jgi:hypothetical protein